VFNSLCQTNGATYSVVTVDFLRRTAEMQCTKHFEHNMLCLFALRKMAIEIDQVLLCQNSNPQLSIDLRCIPEHSRD
jgi:hypothetical protein